jgi:hypothetical protein
MAVLAAVPVARVIIAVIDGLVIVGLDVVCVIAIILIVTVDSGSTTIFVGVNECQCPSSCEC